MEQTDWYAAINGESYGPVTANDLQTWFGEGQISSNDLIWHATLGDWKPYSEVFLETDTEVTQDGPSDHGTESVETAKEPTTETFHCANHPDKTADAICAKCKNDFCNDCLASRDGKFYCPKCILSLPSEKKGFFSKWFSKKK